MEILIIEQTEDYSKFLKNLFADIGQCEVCNSFNDGILKLDQKFEEDQLYDIYLIDLELPDTSAIRLLSKIRGMEESINKEETFIILLSKNKYDSMVMDFFSRGNDIYIEKTEDKELWKDFLFKNGILHKS